MNEDTLVPLIVFGSIIAGIWLFSHFNFKKRHTVHETLRHAIDNGQPVSEDLIQKMSMITDPIKADLRRGVLFVAFGAAFLCLAAIVGSAEQDAIRPLLGVATFPIILGLAYFGLWAFGHDKKAR